MKASDWILGFGAFLISAMAVAEGSWRNGESRIANGELTEINGSPGGREAKVSAPRQGSRWKPGNKGEKMKQKSRSIIKVIIVNGWPVQVGLFRTELIYKMMQRALNRSGNLGRSLSDWELRDAGGQIIDPARRVGELNITPGARLFLNLKAGVGG